AAAVGAAARYTLFRPTFRYAGTLEATKVDLSARLSSTIAAVVPQEGDRVTSGEEVVRLTCDDVKVAHDLADINFARAQRLFKSGTISPDQMDQVRNRKQDADVKLSWCSIRSPLDGTVLSRYHEPGEMVGPGTKLLTLANIKDIWAYIYVPQPDVAALKTGEKLTGYLPELGMKPFQGVILKVNDEAEFTPKNVQTRAERERLVYGVKVGFEGANQDEVLKPGMTIEVQLPK
ncbi:MAG: efflux RND transporter periplasmic adaptor subunit, partial [Elusimicrobia bacterium]|nr:efflux RND transporter periplasmic adaptor subunit [Elusimicrobiota bacterium]